MTLEPSTPAPATPSLRVLVVSADRDYVRLARTVLRAGGHEVRSSSGRADGLRRQARQMRPDVVVLDAHLAALAELPPELAGAGLVLVADEAPQTEAAGTLCKWGAAHDLLAAVEARAGSRRGRLRLVTS